MPASIDFPVCDVCQRPSAPSFDGPHDGATCARGSPVAHPAGMAMACYRIAYEKQTAELARVKEERDALKAQNATQRESVDTAMRMEREARDVLVLIAATFADEFCDCCGTRYRQQDETDEECAAMHHAIGLALERLAPAPAQPAAQPPPDAWDEVAPPYHEGEPAAPTETGTYDEAAPATPKEGAIE